MHLIKDENGNLVQHGHADSHEHTHEHTHEDGVTHSHTHSHAEGDSHCHTHGDGHCGSCESGDCKNETVALLTYMLQNLTGWLTTLRNLTWMQLPRQSRKQYPISRRVI